MRALGVEPAQVIEHFVGEQIHVGEQQILMVTVLFLPVPSPAPVQVTA